MSEPLGDLRLDLLTGEWVNVVGHRQARPNLPSASCPFCVGGREAPEPYDVRWFTNRWPALASGPAVDVIGARANGTTVVPAVGASEVVLFSSEHRASLATLPREQVRKVVDVWAERTTALLARQEVEYVLVFENRGREVGATIDHPHGQIYGYPFVPPRMRRQLDSARRYRDRTGDCLHCTLLAAERRAGTRIVTEDDLFTVVVPHAARWPYEAHLYPRRHVPDLPALTAEERAGLARAYLDLLRRFDRLFPTPTPYVAGWLQAPARRDRDLMHLHAEVFSIRRAAGKLKHLAGSESAAEVWINDISPERAAAALRGEGY
jgi:UDPglucose--hexose-1-phosphate uridylyltransferase